MTISIAEAILEATETMQRAGLTDARREASGLLQHVVARDRTFILGHPEHTLTLEQLEIFRQLALRRASGEPLQYITTQQSFFGLDFEVAKGVLIPRPETELLVETALDLLPKLQPTLTICDVGTGSGCIAITLLHERSEINGVAIDISAEALEIAKRNARRHSVEGRLTFVQANCFSSLSPDKYSFDLIASNPPYVAEAEIPGLQREVRNYEPLEALAGGPDGLNVVRRLLNESAAFLKPAGYLLIEIGFNQAPAVERLIDKAIWISHRIQPDLQGIPRVVVLQRKSN